MVLVVGGVSISRWSAVRKGSHSQPLVGVGVRRQWWWSWGGSVVPVPVVVRDGRRLGVIDDDESGVAVAPAPGPDVLGMK